MKRLFNEIIEYVAWVNSRCFESVAVAASVFSFLYGVRLLILNDFYSYETEVIVQLMHKELPVQGIAYILIVSGFINIMSTYAIRYPFFLISLYALLFIWVLLSISFTTISVFSLNALVAVYMTALYHWIVWRTRGLNFQL